MVGCYVAVVVSLFAGICGGAWLGLQSGAIEVRERFASGEWMRRADIGARQSLP